VVFPTWSRIVNDYVRMMISLATADPLRPFVVDDQFLARSTLIARRMVTQTLNANAVSWRAAAAKSSKGRKIYEALLRERTSGPVAGRFHQLVEENATLIKTLPTTIASRVTAMAAEHQAKGMRAEQLMHMLLGKYPQMVESQARLIARTEVSKAEAAFTQVRAESIGLHWYEWQTSHDVRVRPSHRHMAGVLVSWSDPPSPERLIGERSTLGRYNAGNCPNCRCPALPLVSLNDVRWPHKVYAHGKIQMMTRATFAAIQ
jgi:SPP1 gp7 family putative phage head morphogenesis protein